MAGDLPPRVVSSIAFIGRRSGAIKTLSGFRKPQHTVPDAANAATNAFLAKICAPELTEEAEQLFQQARAGLGYKRKEISLSVASPTASLTAKDFSAEFFCAIDESDPSRYTTTLTLRELVDAALARTEGFERVFAGRFSEIEFAFEKGASVEAIIDAIEALEEDKGLRVDYPSDYHDCVIRVDGVDAEVRCTGASLAIVFPRQGSPAELIDAFATVRDAFQLSNLLRQLLGG